MKKSVGILSLGLLFFCPGAKSQVCDTVPYQHIYFNDGFSTTRMKSFLFTSTNDIYMLGYVTRDSENSNTDAWIMRTTFHGTPLWSKAVGTNAEETINSIKSLDNGGFIFAGSTKYNSLYEVGWLAKTDSMGNPAWSLELKSMNGSLSQVTELANGDIVAVGTLYLNFSGDSKGNITSINKSSNFIIRFDKDGNISWQRSFFHSEKETLNKITQLSDGNLIVTGNNSNNDSAYILKINQNDGSILWMNVYKNVDFYNYTKIIENSDHTIKFKTGNRIYNFSSGGDYINGSVELNLESYGQPLKKVQLEDFGNLNGVEIYYVNTKPDPVLFGVLNDSVIQWAHTYLNDFSNTLTLGGGRIYRNSIYLSGSYKTKSSQDTIGNMAYLLKADLNGETFCAKDFDIRLKASVIPDGVNAMYNWTDYGSVTSTFIPVYSDNIFPGRILDCVQETCCNDVVLNQSGEICENSFYLLPNGKSVSSPGFYTSRMNTLSGCDSVIYTSLTLAKSFKLSLPEDTCMVNNLPVVFNLPPDSTVKYHWQDGNTGENYVVNKPGKYWVTVISDCSIFNDTVTVFNFCAPEVFMPSAFTPNNDGLNDIFKIPQLNGQQIISFSIYNRFGQKIFQSKNNVGWNGTINNKPQPAGTYIYIINYLDLALKPHSVKGTIVLIR